MALAITITDVGREEIINAENTGSAPVEITEVAFGTGQYTPDPAQTSLQNEVKRLPSMAGLIVAGDTIHVTVKDEGNDEYDVNEFGLFTNSGTLLAVYSAASAEPVLQKAAGSTVLIAVDIVLQTLDANSLTFGDISFTNPPASETVVGVARIATQAETHTGTNNSTMVSPKKLADYFLFKLGQVSNVANTFLRRNGDNTAFESRTPRQVASEIQPLLQSATESTRGIVELSTQLEMNAGSSATLVPPVKIVATYIANQIAALVNAAPGTLDTLNELADALGNDPNFATTVVDLIDSKLDKTEKAADSKVLDGLDSTQFMRSDADQVFSGSLNYTPDTGAILTLDGKVALYRHSYNGALSFGSDESLIIGAGESRVTIVDNVDTAAENLIFGAEGGIIFYTTPDNWVSGWDGRLWMSFRNDGELYIGGNIVYHAGNQPTVSEVTGLQAALDEKATSTDIASAIDNLIGGAPGALDTLNELANAMGDDPNFAATVTNELASKLDNTGKAADAELLDGLNSTQFMRADATQNFSGSLNYTPDTGAILTLDGKPALYRHSYNGALSFGADESLIIGAGESRNTIASNVNTVAENLLLGAEGGIFFYTSPDNWGSGWGGRHEMRFGNNGDFIVGSNNNSAIRMAGGTGNAYFTGDVEGLTSDIRVKDITETLDPHKCLRAVLEWDVIRYREKPIRPGADTQKIQLGLIAQQIQKQFPELTPLAPFDRDEKGNSISGNNYLTAKYERTVAVLVGAVRGLYEELEEVKRGITQ